MSIFYLILGMALVTFLIRYIPFAFANRIQFPDKISRALRYVPPAVLTAIIVPSILLPDGKGIQISYTNPYLAGGITAFLVGMYKQNLLITIIVGMLTFFCWKWMLG